MLALQTVVFAIGALRGVQHTPYAWLFRTARPPATRRRRPSSRTRAPPRFAQAVGLGFAAGRPASGFAVRPDRCSALVATGFALAAALLNAVFGFCLGCEIYLLLRVRPPAELTTRADPTVTTDVTKER